MANAEDRPKLAAKSGTLKNDTRNMGAVIHETGCSRPGVALPGCLLDVSVSN
jgi:hypothetical protein